MLLNKTYDHIDDNFTEVTGYKDWSYTVATNKFTLTELSKLGPPAYPIVYGSADNYRTLIEYDRVYKNGEWYGTTKFYEYGSIIYKKGNLIDTVIEEEDIYPDNGYILNDEVTVFGKSNYRNKILPNSFWYEKTTLEESATLTSPNGGETLNEGYNITWTLSAAGLRTKIELSIDNGNTWKTLLTTNAGVTSYNYNFANETESSVCRIRVTPLDNSGNLGTSDVSNGVFTIAHNQAPTVPTNLLPANGIIVDRTEIKRLSWTHNDSDAQSKFDLQWSSNGGSTWTTVTKVSTSQYNDFTANIFPAGTITWRVRTYDQEGLVSPYSNQVTFQAAAPSNAPTITSATTWNVARPTIQWSSVGQAKYQVQILDSVSTITWDSGEIASGNKATTIGADLVNGSTYTVKVRIDSGGIWSSYAVQSISISFTPPEIPLVTVSTDLTRASITLNIVNTEGLTVVTHNDIFRDGQRIATGIIGGFTDYTVESEKEYSYRVRAVGENGTYSDSEVVTSSVPVKHTQLALTANYDKWIELKWNPEKSDNRQHNSVSNYFAGRKFAVTDFSENENNNIPNSFAIRDKAELDKLIEIYDAKQTVIYRDRRGKRLFGTLNNLSIADESPRTWWTVSFTLQQVDFDEVI